MQSTALAQLLGLDGVQVDLAEREDDGSWTLHVLSAAGQQGCCPDCGQTTTRVKEPAVHRFTHVVLVAVRVVWHKLRLRCVNAACDRQGFAEAGPVRKGARIGEQARRVMGHLVGDWLVAVRRVAAGVGVSWHSVHNAFTAVAARAGIHCGATAGRYRPAAGQASAQPGAQGGNGQGGQAAVPTPPGRQAAAALPPVHVLGIDEHRRGRPRYRRDPHSGSWVAEVDRWQTVFVDAGGGHGLLGQVEGRTRTDAVGWVAAQDPAWRAGIGYVSIDMSTGYRAAVTEALPHARLVVDLFHVVQLATKAVDEVRRRVTYARYGRRGRRGDPEYAIRNLLRRGRERLSRRSRHQLLCTLADLGEAGRQIGAAWRAKELVRDLARLCPGRAGQAPSRTQVATALENLFTFAATIAQAIPEVQTLAETISTWRAEIARGVLTGYTNAAAEGTNRLVKLVYRTAFGFTNVTNQQRRSRYTASRSTRPEWLPTVTATPSPSVVT